MEYNEYIKQLRTRNGLTQQQLADDVGVSRQTVTRWEKGWTVPTLYYAQKLAELFGLTVSELMTGQEPAETLPPEQPSPNKNIAARTARFSVLTFLPVVIYCILRALLSSVQSYFAGGETTALDMMSSAYTALFMLCLTASVTMTAFWIIRLVAGLQSATDKFGRYGFSRRGISALRLRSQTV